MAQLKLTLELIDGSCVLFCEMFWCFDFFRRQGKVKQTWREEEDDELRQLFHQYRDNLDPGYFFLFV